ncbi:hypothetical protein HDU87_008032 [Geranomyces variabilis]|uniref:RING-type domain-containing protein n=1 Tax=Geranomyces variabilis TaxID=109894 RepID=A0AAD5XUN5_9FUNG|nr:hypothetical protein HDU87_008032 [Geranomyces variabilis]
MLPSVLSKPPPSLPIPGGPLLRAPAQPPKPSEEQIMKGGHALRKMKQYCEEVFALNSQYIKRIYEIEAVTQNFALVKQGLEAQLQEKNDKIAQLLQKGQQEQRVSRAQEEVEKLLHEDMRKRLKAEKKIIELEKTIEDIKREHSEQIKSVEEEATRNDSQKQLLIDQEKEIERLRRVVRDMEYDLDEQRVLSLKFERKSGQMEKELTELTQKHEYLLVSEAGYREENIQLQKRVRDLLDANREVTLNYQAVKKNQEHKRSEFEALAIELEEAKTACQIAIRQRKQLQVDFNAIVKQRNELVDKGKTMESTLTRKEKDISDLLTKVNDTINDYEQKLEKKEEQMWQMSLQITEAVEKATVPEPAPPPQNIEEKKMRLDVDPDFIDNLEKKFQAKERILQHEIDKLREVNATKERQLGKLGEKITELSKEQYLPRMERLKVIESDIKSKMEEYALAEESMETGFLCPRDVKLFHKPTTLIPCGHTYCQECVEALTEENYNIPKCQLCTTKVTGTFRNEQLECVGEQFAGRKSLTLSFLDWVKQLRVTLPSEIEEAIV